MESKTTLGELSLPVTEAHTTGQVAPARRRPWPCWAC
jgi:hypothetical protein